MDIEPEDDDHRPLEKNVHGQDGQGTWFITLCAAFAVAHAVAKDPYLLPLPDPVIAYFAEAAAKPKSQQECMMMALSRSPPVRCSPERK